MEARQRREAAREEIIAARMRTGLGFGVAYVGEKVAVHALPTLTPDPDSPLNVVGGVVDLALAGGGIYLAVTNTDELGDYATGAAMVGVTQLLDRVVDAVIGVIDRNRTNGG